MVAAVNERKELIRAFIENNEAPGKGGGTTSSSDGEDDEYGGETEVSEPEAAVEAESFAPPARASASARKIQLLREESL